MSHKVKTGSHEKSFAHLLKQGLKDEADAPAAKQDGQQKPAVPLVTVAADNSKGAKPPITLKLGQPVDPAAAGKDLPDPATGGPSYDEPAPDTSDNTLLKNGTSILMAMLSQAKLTSLNLGNPQQVDPKLTSSDPQDPHATAPTLISLAETQNGALAANTIAKGQAGDVLQAAAGLPAADTSQDGIDPDAGSPRPPAAGPSEGHLAFALQISSSDSKTESHRPSQVSPDMSSPASTATISPSAAGFASDGAESSASNGSGGEQHQPSSQDSNTPTAAVQSDTGFSPATVEVAATPEPSAPAASASELDDKEESSAEPVRNVQMQLIGQGNQRVNISLLDRAGQLRVNVRSTDKSLTQNLQDQMPVLTSRLAAERYRTEVWIPGRNNGDNPQQQEQQQDQPDWVDTPEGAGPGTSERINTPWLLQ